MLEFLGRTEELKRRLEHERGITSGVLSQMVRKKQEEFAGLLNEGAAIYAIAKEQGLAMEFAPAEIAFAKVAQLKEGGRDVNLLCRIRRIHALKTFEKNGKKGSLVSMFVEDDSGVVRLVLWNRDAELAERGALEKGDVVEIRNAYVKRNNTGIELHLGLAGSVKRSEKKLERVAGEKKLLKLSQLSEGMLEADIVARILELGSRTDFEREGKKSAVASCVVGDESATVRLVLWDTHADLLPKLRINDVVKVENGYVKKGLKEGERDLHLGWMGRVIVNPKNAEIAERKDILKIPLLRIGELRLGETAEVHARLAEIGEAVSISACANCGAESNLPKCESCGSTGFRKRYFLTARVEDESGSVDATFSGRVAKKAVGIKNIADDIEFATVVNLKREELVGKELYLTGKLTEGKFVVEGVIS